MATTDSGHEGPNDPSFYRDDNAKINFGFRANHLTAVVAKRIIARFYEGAEFLHQVLWQERIKHEYHLVRGADHVGPSVLERHEEAFRFLFRTLDPWPVTQRMRRVDQMLDPLKARAGGTDHYNEPNPTSSGDADQSSGIHRDGHRHRTP